MFLSCLAGVKSGVTIHLVVRSSNKVTNVTSSSWLSWLCHIISLHLPLFSPPLSLSLSPPLSLSPSQSSGARGTGSPSTATSGASPSPSQVSKHSTEDQRERHSVDLVHLSENDSVHDNILLPTATTTIPSWCFWAGAGRDEPIWR